MTENEIGVVAARKDNKIKEGNKSNWSNSQATTGNDGDNECQNSDKWLSVEMNEWMNECIN